MIRREVTVNCVGGLDARPIATSLSYPHHK